MDCVELTKLTTWERRFLLAVNQMKSIFYFASSFLCLSASFALENSIEEPFIEPSIPTHSVAYTPEAVTTEPRGLITPTVSPRVEQGQDVLIDIDFIWWKSYVSNFDYAQINGDILTPHFKFQPGLKVGTGMDLYHDGWDVYTEYTWLYQPDLKNSGNSLTPGYSSLITPFAQGAEEGILSSIAILNTSALRKSLFNILDAEVGRNFFISKRLTLRPNIGIKGASLFERTKITYTGRGPINSAAATLRQNLSGLGIKAGIDTLWHIIPSFGFYGNLSITALWGSFHNTFINKFTLNGDFSSRSYYRNTQDILPVIEAGLGLSYMVWFKQNQYQFYTKAGWEEQIWIGYNKNIVNGMSSSCGSLTLQGLTWKLGLAF